MPGLLATMNASPTKRRALAALDVNAPSPGSGSKTLPKTGGTGSDALATAPKPLPSPPPEEDAATKKRPPPAPPVDEQPAKKTCRVEAPPRAEAAGGDSDDGVGGGEVGARPAGLGASPMDRTPTASPAPSSVFDSSALDTSQATTLTDADADGPLAALLAAGPPPARRVLTREESRQRAETLRLRLSLASYKLKTGQADVPLDQLQVRPLPGSAAAARPARARTPLPSAPARRTGAAFLLPRTGRDRNEAASSSSSSSSSQEDGDKNASDSDASPAPSASASPEKRALLPLRHPGAAFTPRARKYGGDDERLTSSALRDGAASGLLRLRLARS